ncbi:hypothetical protein [Miltoncostaea oceani]|uniref:hypothetical protein n=1 Tax=Miltoncostaea oceani TaxID=2843216 RepID=UPI001C3D7A86|nr:hypothetical protein [Miltoncostaea oceani]
MGHPPAPPLSRVLSWLVGCVVVAWLVVYNVMRITGSNPSDAALPSLGIGVVVGAVVFAVGLVAVRRLAAAGRVVTPGPVEIPGPAQLEPAQRDALNLAWPALGAMALVALGLGAYLGLDWLGTDSDARATTTLILAVWNVLVGLWLGDEALRLRRGEADGIESIVLGCGLTAVLAGVGLSRDLAGPAQMVLIVLAGAAGLLVALAVWRLRGARGVPVGAVGVVVAAALSLILPLVL